MTFIVFHCGCYLLLFRSTSTSTLRSSKEVANIEYRVLVELLQDLYRFYVYLSANIYCLIASTNYQLPTTNILIYYSSTLLLVESTPTLASS